MLLPFAPTRLTTKCGNLEIIMETGKMAKQASGAVWVQCGGTVVHVTAVNQHLEVDRGFFPLTVNYQEMSYAAGRIPGSYFRREIGRPSERETLVSRLIDRPIRPMFKKGFRDEVQIIATVLSADDTINPDVLAITGASAALHLSPMPFEGPICGARVGYVNGEFVLFPSYKQIANESKLNLIFAATREAIVMVEGGAEFVSEELVVDALEWAHKQLTPMFDIQDELRNMVGKPKIEVVAPVVDEAVQAVVEEIATPGLKAAFAMIEKGPRREAKAKAKDLAMEAVAAKFPDDSEALRQAGNIVGTLEKKIVRERVRAEKIRIDGRDTTTVRPLSIEAGTLPMTHGSALFTRGETTALAVVTLGSSRDEQRIETLVGEDTKRFMLHYNFPPYCVGEVRILRGPSRRDIGHGALAERSMLPVLPNPDDFPFTLRVVSEVMDSNGSSSMATICGASLALMDAGVPITEPVAGIAMGLMKEGDEYIVLTDILGDEDALGDMDFKVAGSARGITGIQMDIKIMSGIPYDVLRRALAQSRDARKHILEHMAMCLDAPRPQLSELAPQMEVVFINPEKIRSVIGPGGKNIKAITAETGASIDIEDSGKVAIFAPTSESLKKAKAMVMYYDQTPEPGRNYLGTVRKILEVGALVEILPGAEGMLHVSQMDVERVERVEDLLQLGQEVWVKVIELEANGRIRLSRKAWLMEQAGQEVNLDEFRRPPSREGDRGGRGGDRDRGRGGDRGGRDRGPRR
ncbi:MAG: polyribonucleotide nucleotidyltransferase [Humidesulfovibrio sp.]|uniref:polyribonucleotide nucleotidyltransferase n=1 Tax=Humidesulfovibrio sp. TaxID=2910988 RepID=UPI0027FDBFBE|nr:polyribonucleotide nucleotidyltransferase [Humidesulfovibrio sp.]MDQ7833884.1 polyribonucleotide nucleotidyltransferase [Humidesulfovibrio sp.]